jgi:hypothetical protein
LTRRCPEFEAGEADAEAARAKKGSGDAGSFKVSGKPTPAKTNFELRSVYKNLQSNVTNQGSFASE